MTISFINSPEKMALVKQALQCLNDLLSSPTSADRDADPAQAEADLVLVQEMLRDLDSSGSVTAAVSGDAGVSQTSGDNVWPRTIKVAVIASDAMGSPTFLMSEHVVTQDEYDNGVHYERAKELAYDEEYEGPMSAFDSRDYASRQIGELLAFFGKENQTPVESSGDATAGAHHADQAVKFAAQVAGLKVWDFNDMNECDEPSDGYLDSHSALMDLILQARGVNKASGHQPAVDGPACPNCGEPVEGHPENGCILGALVRCLEDRGEHDEDELAEIHANVNTDLLWSDLGPILDNLADGKYQ